MMDMNTQMRLTGMASGLDTDAIIQQLGKVHTMRVDAVKRDKTYTLWRQEALRNVIGMVSNFQKSNLNIANPSSNFLSANAFAKFSFNLSVGGGNSADAKDAAAKVLSVTANGDIKNFNQTVQAVTQLASKDTWSGEEMGFREITTKGFDFRKFVRDTGMTHDDGSGEKPVLAMDNSVASISLSIDGVTRTVVLNGAKLSEIAEKVYIQKDGNATELFAEALNEEIAKQFGKDYKGLVTVKKGELSFHKSGSNITLNNTLGGNTLGNIGLDNGGVSNGSINDKKLSELLGTGADGFFDFVRDKDGSIVYDSVKNADGSYSTLPRMNSRAITINGDSIVIKPDDTVGSLLSKINSSNAGINLSYSTAGDKFTLTSKNEGTASNVGDITGAAAELFGMLRLGSTVMVEVTKDVRQDDGSLKKVTETEARLLTNGKKLELGKNEAVNVGIWKGGEDRVDVMMVASETDGEYIIKLRDGTELGTARFNDGKFVYTWNDDIPDSDHDYRKDQITNMIDRIAVGSVGSRSEGTNLIAMINGETFIRQSNTFQYEGMTYTFHNTFNADKDKAEYDADTGKITYKGSAQDTLKIDVSKNTSDIMDSIKSFVDEYNKIIEYINDLLTQKRDRDYKPLTDEEKASMKEEDIKLYEEKAKLGMLASDSDLRKLADQMRAAIYQKVEGVGLSMADIGITTAAYGWKDGGKLVIQEDKLQNALENNYDSVVALFTKAADKDGKGGGVARRLNSVMDAAVGTIGDKGYLVKRAGTVNDKTQYDNAMQKQITAYDERIKTLLERWYKQESQYIKQFTRMETALSKMTAQQNSLASLMGQSSN